MLNVNTGALPARYNGGCNRFEKRRKQKLLAGEVRSTFSAEASRKPSKGESLSWNQALLFRVSRSTSPSF